MSTYKDLKGKAKTLYDSLEDYITHNREAVDLLNLFKSYSEEVIKEALNTQNNNLTLLELARSIQPKNEYLKEKKSAIIQIIEQKMKEAGLKVSEQPSIDPNGQAFQETNATPTSTQSGQTQAHGGEDMITDLTPEQQGLYHEILNCNRETVGNVLKNANIKDVIKVLSVTNKDGDTVLTVHIKKDMTVVETLFNHINKPTEDIHSVTESLENRALSAILEGSNYVARKIINFSQPYKKLSHFICSKLKTEFKKAVKEGDFKNANTFYKFGKGNNIEIFRDELLKGTWLSDTIAEVNLNKNITFLANTLKFAKEHNILQEVFEANVQGKNLLAFAEEQGVKAQVEKVIEDAGIKDPVQHSQPPVDAGSPASPEAHTTPAPSSPSPNNRTGGSEPDDHEPTFWDENKGKIAAGLGVVGMIWMVSALAAGLPFGAACAVGILGALATLTAIGIAGKMAYDTVNERAKKDGTSNWEATKSVLSPGRVEQPNPGPGVS